MSRIKDLVDQPPETRGKKGGIISIPAYRNNSLLGPNPHTGEGQKQMPIVRIT
jgi:hypothetical protein